MLSVVCRLFSVLTIHHMWRAIAAGRGALRPPLSARGERENSLSAPEMLVAVRR